MTGEILDTTTPRQDTAGAATASIVEREANGLLSYFARRVASPEDAADLLGETLLTLWRRKDSVPADETRARMWIYGVARKVLATHRRSAFRRTALTERLRCELVALQESPHPGDPLSDYVRTLIEDLPDIDKEIFTLVYWEGFSLMEVAGIMAMRPATVRSRHGRARAQLKYALEQSGDIDSQL